MFDSISNPFRNEEINFLNHIERKVNSVNLTDKLREEKPEIYGFVLKHLTSFYALFHT
jgi:hypothetical protein